MAIENNLNVHRHKMHADIIIFISLKVKQKHFIRFINVDSLSDVFINSFGEKANLQNNRNGIVYLENNLH